MKLSSLLVGFLVVALCVAGFAQTTQTPANIPSGTTTSGYGPYDILNLGTALKTYKMFCFEAQPNAGPDTCIFRDYAGHLSVWNGSGSTELFSLGSEAPAPYQGTTSVGITTTSFTALVAAGSDISLLASSLGTPGKKIKVHFDGIYTNAAASLLNAEVMLCTVSGCGSGTVVAPAGCVITSTNQANDVTNGQFSGDCTLIATSTVGASGTFMAKSLDCFQLGSAVTAASSCFNDQATAVSAAVNETVAQFVNIGFKFSTSNAGNSATLMDLSVSTN